VEVGLGALLLLVAFVLLGRGAGGLRGVSTGSLSGSGLWGSFGRSRW